MYMWKLRQCVIFKAKITTAHERKSVFYDVPGAFGLSRAFQLLSLRQKLSLSPILLDGLRESSFLLQLKRRPCFSREGSLHPKNPQAPLPSTDK